MNKLKKNIFVITMICLLLCTVTYTYSAFRNTIEGTINATTNWVFKLKVDDGIKEENYYNVPISGTSGSFDITIDNSKNKYGASYVIELEPINLPDDIVINDLRYEDNITKISKTYNIKYSSSSSINGYIKVKVEATKYEYAVMKNGHIKRTEFWDGYFWYIKTIEFNNNLDNLPSSCTKENLCWDISDSSSPNSVYGYLVDSGEINSSSKTLYNLYIVSEYEIYAPNTCFAMFSTFPSMVSIEFNNNFNTSNVTDMERMFEQCNALTSLDLSSFNTTNVTNMNDMFSVCIALTTLDLSNFNTSNVIEMYWMFSSCSALTSLDLSSFNTTNVTSMNSMFSNCKALTSLDLSSFNTSNVTNMSSMFYRCSALTSLDLSSFNTSNVTNMNYMFSCCSALKSLDLSSFNTSNVTNMNYMFSSCSALTSLDLSSFNTSNVTDMSYMFYTCSALTSLDLSSFNTSNVTDMSYMFGYCSALTSLDLSSFNTSNVTDMSYMFYTCSALTTTINIMNPSLTNYSIIFNYTSINSNAQVTVNYIETTSDLVDEMIATKSSNSNVIKGNIIYEHAITISDNTDITYQSNNTYVGALITLNSISGNNYVTSFKMNGTLIKGNTFTMPNTDAIITDITTVDCIIIESDHNPYLNNQYNVIIGEHTFEGAKSLTVILAYQTEAPYYDYFYIYDSASATTGINNNKKYGGSTRPQETITINSNYIKITFSSNDSGNNYYGLKAIVIPNY